MTGGLLQLSAIGKQDVLLTGKPQTNFFKTVYKRHVAFAIESIRQTTVGFLDFGQKFEIEISRKADLIYGMYFCFNLPALSIPAGSTYVGWTDAIGHAIIEYVDLEIGGNRIDRQYGLWMDIWDELTTSESHRDAKNSMIGKFDDPSLLQTNAATATEYFVPLPFWFNLKASSSLPLVALQFHAVKLIFKLRPFSQCVTFDGGTPPTAVRITSGAVHVDYVYLEDSVRAKFAQESHILLIEQVQFEEQINQQAVVSALKLKQTLTSNHPVKELVWVLIEQASLNNNDWFNFSRRADTTEQMVDAVLLLDGQERFEKRSEAYFRLVQPYQHHTHGIDKHIYVYSFGLTPEDIQPSGTMNFSRFDSVELQVTIRAGNPETNLNTFATNYNLLVIRNGMANVLFSS